MADPVVETKLLLPRPRRDSIPRPRLADALARAERTSVTLVSAPAGFGKTTLVGAWLAAMDHPVAWVSLDLRDRRPTSFWTYVLTALDRAVPGCATAALALLHSGQSTVEAALAGVVNELSVTAGDVTLVLDDYHLAEGPDLADGMGFLVNHLPPQLHLVISTRVDPALPLARMRVRGDLTEIRAADLRFDRDEAVAYLNGVNALDLSPDALAALEERTEGWVAALQLAALSLRDRPDASGFIDRFAGNDRFVVDYLVDEVLDRQPDDVHRFLLDTAVLDQLSAPLCDAVHGAAPGTSRGMLDLLDRQNLFLVPLDDQRQWYRYHHLFADVLRAHLAQTRPEDAAELHRRASRWYAANEDVEEAVRHALNAGDAATAAELAESALPTLRRERREAVVRGWADELPAEVVSNRPVLAIGLVGGLMASNDFTGVDARLRDVEEMLEQPAGELVVIDDPELASVPARIKMFRAALALVGGDPGAAIVCAREAIAAAPAGDDLTLAAASALAGLGSWASGDLVAAHTSYLACANGLERDGYIADVLGCALAIADMELELGRLRDAERSLQDAFALAQRHRPETPGPGGTPVGGAGVLRGTADMLVGLSRAAWHRDDLAAATELLRRADELGESAGLPQNPYRWRVALARLRAVERDWPAALALLDDAERVYVGDFSPPVHPIHATRARVLTASGDVDAALAWAHDRRLDVNDDLTYLNEYEHVTLAKVLLARHRVTGDSAPLRDAGTLLDRLLAAAEAGSRNGTVIEVEVVRALTYHAAGREDIALAAIQHAVDLAEPEGWVRFLIDAGPELDELLATLVERRPSSRYVRTLLRSRVGGAGPAAHAIAPAVSAGSGRDLAGRQVLDAATAGVAVPISHAGQAAPESLMDPLSDRELDVLRLLGSDLDGPAIARELIVSLNTVRTHTKHIYTKLGVNNHRAAISRAHQLGLLAHAART
jgi:LuxR family transcriptional regulator, maltose regulon positive regulatory protein